MATVERWPQPAPGKVLIACECSDLQRVYPAAPPRHVGVWCHPAGVTNRSRLVGLEVPGARVSSFHSLRPRVASTRRLAGLYCRQRRIRCDGQAPCGSCAGRGKECEYPTEPPKKRGPKSTKSSEAAAGGGAVPVQKPAREVAHVTGSRVKSSGGRAAGATAASWSGKPQGRAGASPAPAPGSASQGRRPQDEDAAWAMLQHAAVRADAGMGAGPLSGRGGSGGLSSRGFGHAVAGSGMRGYYATHGADQHLLQEPGLEGSDDEMVGGAGAGGFDEALGSSNRAGGTHAMEAGDDDEGDEGESEEMVRGYEYLQQQQQQQQQHGRPPEGGSGLAGASHHPRGGQFEQPSYSPGGDGEARDEGAEEPEADGSAVQGVLRHHHRRQELLQQPAHGPQAQADAPGDFHAHDPGVFETASAAGHYASSGMGSDSGSSRFDIGRAMHRFAGRSGDASARPHAATGSLLQHARHAGSREPQVADYEHTQAFVARSGRGAERRGSSDDGISSASAARPPQDLGTTLPSPDGRDWRAIDAFFAHLNPGLGLVEEEAFKGVLGAWSLGRPAGPLEPPLPRLWWCAHGGMEAAAGPAEAPHAARGGEPGAADGDATGAGLMSSPSTAHVDTAQLALYHAVLAVGYRLLRGPDGRPPSEALSVSGGHYETARIAALSVLDQPSRPLVSALLCMAHFCTGTLRIATASLHASFAFRLARAVGLRADDDGLGTAAAFVRQLCCSDLEALPLTRGIFPQWPHSQPQAADPSSEVVSPALCAATPAASAPAPSVLAMDDASLPPRSPVSMLRRQQQAELADSRLPSVFTCGGGEGPPLAAGPPGEANAAMSQPTAPLAATRPCLVPTSDVGRARADVAEVGAGSEMAGAQQTPAGMRVDVPPVSGSVAGGCGAGGGVDELSAAAAASPMAVASGGPLPRLDDMYFAKARLASATDAEAATSEEGELGVGASPAAAPRSHGSSSAAPVSLVIDGSSNERAPRQRSLQGRAEPRIAHDQPENRDHPSGGDLSCRRGVVTLLPPQSTLGYAVAVVANPPGAQPVEHVRLSEHYLSVRIRELTAAVVRRLMQMRMSLLPRHLRRQLWGMVEELVLLAQLPGVHVAACPLACVCGLKAIVCRQRGCDEEAEAFAGQAIRLWASVPVSQTSQSFLMAFVARHVALIALSGDLAAASADVITFARTHAQQRHEVDGVVTALRPSLAAMETAGSLAGGDGGGTTSQHPDLLSQRPLSLQPQAAPTPSSAGVSLSSGAIAAATAAMLLGRSGSAAAEGEEPAPAQDLEPGRLRASSADGSTRSSPASSELHSRSGSGASSLAARGDAGRGTMGWTVDAASGVQLPPLADFPGFATLANILSSVARCWPLSGFMTANMMAEAATMHGKTQERLTHLVEEICPALLAAPHGGGSRAASATSGSDGGRSQPTMLLPARGTEAGSGSASECSSAASRGSLWPLPAPHPPTPCGGSGSASPLLPAASLTTQRQPPPELLDQPAECHGRYLARVDGSESVSFPLTTRAYHLMTATVLQREISVPGDSTDPSPRPRARSRDSSARGGSGASDLREGGSLELPRAGAMASGGRPRQGIPGASGQHEEVQNRCDAAAERATEYSRRPTGSMRDDSSVSGSGQSSGSALLEAHTTDGAGGGGSFTSPLDMLCHVIKHAQPQQQGGDASVEASDAGLTEARGLLSHAPSALPAPQSSAAAPRARVNSSHETNVVVDGAALPARRPVDRSGRAGSAADVFTGVAEGVSPSQRSPALQAAQAGARGGKLFLAAPGGRVLSTGGYFAARGPELVASAAGRGAGAAFLDVPSLQRQQHPVQHGGARDRRTSDGRGGAEHAALQAAAVLAAAARPVSAAHLGLAGHSMEETWERDAEARPVHAQGSSSLGSGTQAPLAGVALTRLRALTSASAADEDAAGGLAEGDAADGTVGSGSARGPPPSREPRPAVHSLAYKTAVLVGAGKAAAPPSKRPGELDLLPLPDVGLHMPARLPAAPPHRPGGFGRTTALMFAEKLARFDPDVEGVGAGCAGGETADVAAGLSLPSLSAPETLSRGIYPPAATYSHVQAALPAARVGTSASGGLGKSRALAARLAALSEAGLGPDSAVAGDAFILSAMSSAAQLGAAGNPGVTSAPSSANSFRGSSAAPAPQGGKAAAHMQRQSAGLAKRPAGLAPSAAGTASSHAADAFGDLGDHSGFEWAPDWGDASRPPGRPGSAAGVGFKRRALDSSQIEAAMFPAAGSSTEGHQRDGWGSPPDAGVPSLAKRPRPSESSSAHT